VLTDKSSRRLPLDDNIRKFPSVPGSNISSPILLDITSSAITLKPIVVGGSYSHNRLSDEGFKINSGRWKAITLPSTVMPTI